MTLKVFVVCFGDIQRGGLFDIFKKSIFHKFLKDGIV